MIRVLLLMVACLLLSPAFAQQGDCRIDFEQALRAQGLLYPQQKTESFYYKDDLQALRIQVPGKGIVAQFFRISPQHWLFIHYPAAKYNAIYKSVDTTFVDEKRKECLRPLAYLRDWPQPSDSIGQQRPLPLFSKDLNASSSLYYVDGKLAVSEDLRPLKTADSLSYRDYAWMPPAGKHYPRRFFVRVDSQHFYGHQQPSPNKYSNGLYRVDTTLRSFNMEVLNPDTGAPETKTRKFLELIPTDYWETDLDTLYEDWDIPYTAKGFYKNAQREGWWMQLSKDGSELWMGYFQQDSLIQLHKGSAASWGEVGKNGCVFRAQSQRINNTEVKYEMPSSLNDCLEAEWHLSPQPVLQADGRVVEGFVAWQDELPAFAKIRDRPRRVSYMKLKSNGTLLYWRGDEHKKYKGTWRLEAQPLKEGENKTTTSVILILEEAYNAEERFRILWMQKGLLGLELLNIEK